MDPWRGCSVFEDPQHVQPQSLKGGSQGSQPFVESMHTDRNDSIGDTSSHDAHGLELLAGLRMKSMLDIGLLANFLGRLSSIFVTGRKPHFWYTGTPAVEASTTAWVSIDQPCEIYC